MPVASRSGVPLRVLFVGVDGGISQTLVAVLAAAGFQLTTERVSSPARLTRALDSDVWDLAFAAARARQCSAKRTLSLIKSSGLAIPVVVVGAASDLEKATVAMRAGARDFLRTDSMDWVVPIVERELRTSQELAAHRVELTGCNSEIHELSEKLRHRQKLHLVGSLVTGIAHDFNNMLSVVMSFARAAVEDCNPTPELREDLVEIVKASESAAELSRRLLGFARLQPSGDTTADVNTVISGTEKMFRRVLGERIELVLSLAPELPSVRASPGQLEQILMNLVVNARDAMPQGGQLRIATSPQDVSSLVGNRPAPGGGVLLVVSDTGVGMDAATRARVFEPFFTTKPEGKGTGLGLSTVIDIVRQNGGSLELETEPGRGTRFQIRLLSGEERPRGEAVFAHRKSAIPPGTAERVLLVEDDARVRSCFQRILSRKGYTVLASSSAEEALRVAGERRHAFDLLMCDVALPGISGPDLAERLALGKRGTPVLFLSGYPDETLA